MFLQTVKKCRHCGTNVSKFGWRRDRWFNKGWYCETCYNCIDMKESRGFINMKYHLRRKGKFKKVITNV